MEINSIPSLCSNTAYKDGCSVFVTFSNNTSLLLIYVCLDHVCFRYIILQILQSFTVCSTESFRSTYK